MSDTTPLPFTRCPSCGAIDWPPDFPVDHRPRCPNDGTTPSQWKDTP